jgi:hypothetical protein
LPSLSSIIGVIVLLVVLRVRFGRFGGRLILSSSLKSTVASVVMGAIIYILISESVSALRDSSRTALIGVSLAVGVAAYIALAVLFQGAEVAFLKGILRKEGEKN